MSWFWYTPYNRSHNVASRLTSECAGNVMPRSALSSGVVCRCRLGPGGAKLHAGAALVSAPFQPRASRLVLQQSRRPPAPGKCNTRQRSHTRRRAKVSGGLPARKRAAPVGAWSKMQTLADELTRTFSLSCARSGGTTGSPTAPEVSDVG